MDTLFQQITNELRPLKNAPPENQREMVWYYRSIMSALMSARDAIEDAILFIRHRIEECNDEF